MTGPGDGPCARVFDRMVERGDLGGDAALAEHARSCMSCFRALAELKDVPRLKEILRASPPAGQPAAGDPFWDQLAARVSGAMVAGPTSRPAGRVGRRVGRRVAGGIGLALMVAAAAWVVAIRRPSTPNPGALVTTTMSLAPIANPLASDDASEVLEVGELDGKLLERLADRLRSKHHLATFAAGDDGADGDEDLQLNDELAELDVPALLRIERSLARTAL
jgi:hypothetical protein